MNIGWWFQAIGGTLAAIGFFMSPKENVFRSIIMNVVQVVQVNNYYQIINNVDKINYDTLIHRYSFGYIIFAIEYNKVKLIPGPMHLSSDYEINWNKAGLYKLTSDVIGINLPDIKYKLGGCGNVGIEVHRVLKIPQRSPIQWSGFAFDIYIELLEDNGSRLVLVLGLAPKQ